MLRGRVHAKPNSHLKTARVTGRVETNSSEMLESKCMPNRILTGLPGAELPGPYAASMRRGKGKREGERVGEGLEVYIAGKGGP